MRRSVPPPGFARLAILVIAAVGLLASAAVLIWLLAWRHALETADQVASVTATALAIVLAGATLLRWWRPAGAGSPGPYAADERPTAHAPRSGPAGQRRPEAQPVGELTPQPQASRARATADRSWTPGRPLGADKSTSALALGVHPAAHGAPPGDAPRLDAELPAFVRRDAGDQVATWMRSAASTGGVLVVIGDSSVGKTRLLYETARSELATFPVLVPDPADDAPVDRLLAAAANAPGLVVWLDELHRFLPGPFTGAGGGVVTASLVRLLLDQQTPVVLLGSMWPEHLRALMATETEPESGVTRLRHPDAAAILDHGRCRKIVLGGFSAAERNRAKALGRRDPRLDEALHDRAFNVTEALAGAPRLVERFEHATALEQAVLLAAVDARRLGILAPLTERLLRATAGGYSGSAGLGAGGLPGVLDELTSRDRPLDRATAPLLPVVDPKAGAVAGYTVADYLQQWLTRRRRREPVPAAAWEALLAHTTDQADLLRLADAADRRGMYRYAIPLYRRALTCGAGRVAPRLATLLAAQGSAKEALTVLAVAGAAEPSAASSGPWTAMFRLATSRARSGDQTGAITALKGALASAETTFALATAQLNDPLRLASTGDLRELRTRADCGDRVAAWTLADLLEANGEAEQAIAVLAPHAEAGDQTAARRLAQLRRQNDIGALRSRADSGERESAAWLANRLLAEGRRDDALAVLGAHADAGDRTAARRLATLLAEQADVEGLRARAGAGERTAALTLADLLHTAGEAQEAMDVLRPLADAGDHVAACTLAELLHGTGSPKEAIELLGPHAESGDRASACTLADLRWATRGGEHEALEVLKPHADVGELLAAKRLGDLLAGCPRPDRTEHEPRHRLAAWTLAGRLHARGETDEAVRILKYHADAGHTVEDATLVSLLDAAAELNATVALPRPGEDGRHPAAWTLTDRLQGAGASDDAVAVLRARTEAGDRLAAWTLADLLNAMGRAGEAAEVLRMRADLGDLTAARRLAELLAQAGDVEGLRTRSDGGDQAAALRLASILAKGGDVDGLRAEIFAGNTGHAADAMRKLLGPRSAGGGTDGGTDGDRTGRSEPPWYGLLADASPATAPA